MTGEERRGGGGIEKGRRREGGGKEREGGGNGRGEIQHSAVCRHNSTIQVQFRLVFIVPLFWLMEECCCHGLHVYLWHTGVGDGSGYLYQVHTITVEQFWNHSTAIIVCSVLSR